MISHIPPEEPWDDEDDSSNDENRHSVESEELDLPKLKTDINQLYKETVGSCKMTVLKALELGAKLEQVRKGMKHGKWGTWVDTNLDFDVRTASNYRKLHQKRELVLAKYESVSDLTITDAYRAIARFPKPNEISNKPKQAASQEQKTQTVAATTKSDESEEMSLDAGLPKTSDSEEEIIVGAFSPQHLEQILDFLREKGVAREAYQVLRGQGAGPKAEAKPSREALSLPRYAP